jgi:PIN domain nuclease of toxin-antitoxin system
MKYLPDTNILLWYLDGDSRLSESFIHTISSESNVIFISIASLWEIAIKSAIGKLELKRGFENTLSLIESSDEWSILSVTPAHLKTLYSLPFHHNDPFDRLIYAQCVAEEIEFLYTDKVFDLYRRK